MAKLETKDLHDIQLESIRMVSLNCFVDDEFNNSNTGSIKVETNIGNYGEVINETEGKTFLKTEVKGKKDEQVVFNIEVIYEGICLSKNSIDKEEYEFFLEVQSIPMLWGYARETINNITLKMGLKPILLPVLNISKIIKDMREAKEGAGGEE